MRWLLVDIAVGVVALVGLALLVVNLWRKVKDLGAEVGRAGEAVDRATRELAERQAERPPSA